MTQQIEQRLKGLPVRDRVAARDAARFLLAGDACPADPADPRADDVARIVAPFDEVDGIILANLRRMGDAKRAEFIERFGAVEGGYAARIVRAAEAMQAAGRGRRRAGKRTTAGVA